jgi:hypothetical protein
MMRGNFLRHEIIIATTIIIAVITASCIAERTVPINTPFELSKGESVAIENGMKVTLENIEEPLLNIKVDIPGKESKNLQFEIESPTAPRSYNVDDVTVNFISYTDGVGTFSVTK